MSKSSAYLSLMLVYPSARILNMPMSCLLFVLLGVAAFSVEGFDQTDESLALASAVLVADKQVGLSSDSGVSRGVAWGDFTGDSFPDLAIANTDGGQLFVYRNINGTHFERVTSGDVTKFQGNAQGVSWPDVNNDGWLDLFVAAEEAANLLYLNDGQGALNLIEAGDLTEHKTQSTQGCWADFDNDGLLDVYVVNADYQDDVLYRNIDGRTFKVVDGPWVGQKNHGRSCAWGDPDNDGRPDIYIANAYFMVGEERQTAANLFFRNTAEGFRQVMTGEFVNVYGYSYGVSWRDFDQDGDEDLFVSNIGRYEPNMLYENVGGEHFSPMWSSRIMRDAPGPVKGHLWADFDNDGDTDLFVAEGHGGARPEHAPFDNVNRYYENRNGQYQPAGIAVLTEDSRVSAGTAGADIDLDGDIDLVIANWAGDDLNNEFYRNKSDGKSSGNWLSLKLQGARSNRQGVGAKVTVTTQDGESAPNQYQTLWLNTGYASMNEPVLHFGVNRAKKVDKVVVNWPSGVTDEFLNIQSNRRYIIIEERKIELLD